MPCFDQVSYSESACIAAITNYYKFLISMYLEESSVEWPPEGGWPEITPEAFEGMHKSDGVISLLRQIPYLRESNDWEEWEQPHGVPHDNFCNWKNEAGHEGRQDFDGLKIMTEGYFSEGTTEHMIGLMMGARNSTHAILDTQYGVVYWPDCADEIKDDTRHEEVWGEPEEIGSKKEENLRCEPAWAIDDFFAMLKEQFVRLNWIPINSRQVVESYSSWVEDEEMQPILKGIYRGHGWPDVEKYKKEECIFMVEKAMDERYPDFSLV
ncbi:hypothetical protein IQ06DRAFT_286956, partial [Phaeosphaeriaceae sp. SRC1lsM3a]